MFRLENKELEPMVISVKHSETKQAAQCTTRHVCIISFSGDYQQGGSMGAFIWHKPTVS